MEVYFNHNGQSWVADLDLGVDISIPVAKENSISAWGLGPPEITPHRQGAFVGSVRAGASVNFNDIHFNPHAHGTHTDCLGHISRDMESVNSHPPGPWMIATLVSMKPVPVGGDSVVTCEQLKDALADLSTEAVIIRTLPNPETKKAMDYSGTNPPYLQGEAASWLNEQGVNHLLLDLPSVDREEDGGALASHRAFWGVPDRPRHTATITECIYVPDRLKDGIYLLNLQMAAIENDACPSRPVLFPMQPQSG